MEIAFDEIDFPLIPFDILNDKFAQDFLSERGFKGCELGQARNANTSN